MNAVYEEGYFTISPTHFSTYAIKSTAEPVDETEYTFKAQADKEHYNVGDTIKVDIIASATEAKNISTFQFSLDASKIPSSLEFQNISTTLGEATAVNGMTMAWNVNNANGIAVNSDGVTIATATFKVLSTATEGQTVTFDFVTDKQEVTTLGRNVGATITTSGSTATLHNLIVTLKPGANGKINNETADVILYAKYNEAGLYSNEERTEEAAVTVAAKTGYHLADKQWKDANNTEYADFAAIAALKPTADATYTLQTVQQFTITIGTPINAELKSGSSDAPITVDAGKKYSELTLPEYDDNANYTAGAWYVGEGAESDPALDMNAEINGNVTIYYKAIPATFTISQAEGNSSNAAITYTEGVTGSNVTYGTEVKLTVTPVGNKLVQSVTYTVAGGTESKTATLTGGVYTIPGTDITGNIVVEVVTKDYVTITFEAGTGTTLTNATAYAYSGEAALYTTKGDTALSDTFTVPTPGVANGYRLAKDTAEEPLWKAGNIGYQSSALGTSAKFAEDTTLTAQAVKVWTVTFAAGANGSISATNPVTVDHGAKVTEVPTTTAYAGYVFKEWQKAGSAVTPADVEITEDTTFTAVFEDGTYSVSLPTGVANLTADGDSEATHGTNYSFTITLGDNILVTEVSYKIGTGDEVILPSDNLTSGTYTFTIPGNAITDNISVAVKSNATYTITIAVSGEQHGTISATSKTYNAGATIGESDFTVTPDAGYKFSWNEDPAGKTVTADKTYTVTFADETYTVTKSDGNATATHGTDYTFTPAGESGKLVTGVTAQINGEDVPVTKNANGTYTIAGDKIIGDIILTYDTIEATWEFISYEAYKALASGSKTQVAILNTAKMASGSYALSGYADMLWSTKYSGYVYIVSDSETETTLTAKLSINTNEVVEVDYSGNTNGDERVTAADSATINDALHNVATSYQISIPMRLSLDVTGDKSVTDQDIVWVLNEAVGNS